MAGALDARARALASRMIAKYGKVITLSQDTPGNYNPATGTQGISTVNTQVAALVQGMPSGKEKSTNTDMVNKPEIEVQISAADLTTNPKQRDRVTSDGITYTIVDEPVPVYSGAQVVLWKLHASL